MSDILVHADAMYLSIPPIFIRRFLFHIVSSIWTAPWSIPLQVSWARGTCSEKPTQPSMYTIFWAVSIALQNIAVLSLDFSDTASHGVRTVDNLKNHCGIQDPEILEVSVNLRAIDASQIISLFLLSFPSERGRALRKGHCKHILCRWRSRHCTSSGSQIHYG